MLESNKIDIKQLALGAPEQGDKKNFDFVDYKECLPTVVSEYNTLINSNKDDHKQEAVKIAFYGKLVFGSQFSEKADLSKITKSFINESWKYYNAEYTYKKDTYTKFLAKEKVEYKDYFFDFDINKLKKAVEDYGYDTGLLSYLFHNKLLYPFIDPSLHMNPRIWEILVNENTPENLNDARSFGSGYRMEMNAMRVHAYSKILYPARKNIIPINQLFRLSIINAYESAKREYGYFSLQDWYIGTELAEYLFLAKVANSKSTKITNEGVIIENNNSDFNTTKYPLPQKRRF